MLEFLVATGPGLWYDGLSEVGFLTPARHLLNLHSRTLVCYPVGGKIGLVQHHTPPGGGRSLSELELIRIVAAATAEELEWLPQKNAG